MGVLTFIWISVLIRIAFIDLATLKIPDRWNLALLLAGIISIPLRPDILPADRLAGIFAVSLPMLLMDFLIPGGFGGGDIKLMAAAGLFLGWKGVLLAGCLAVGAAGIYGTILLIIGKAGKEDCFAFAPFLCGGLAVTALAGEKMLMWLQVIRL